MKKILLIIFGLILLPSIALAITVPWNKVVPGQVYPPLAGDAAGIGTSTPTAQLTVASTTSWQISLSNGAGVLQWTLRNAGGNLYFSTTTVAGNSTSTTAALQISGSGFSTTTIRGLDIIGQATSTSNVGFNTTTGCYAIGGVCISGGSSIVTGTGNVSTSTNEVSGDLAYWTSNSATPALLGKVATTSVTCSGSVSCTGFNVLGSSPITITGSGGSASDPFSHPRTGWSATTSSMAIGTSTISNLSTLTLSSSTAPQIALGAGVGISQWVMRNQSGNLYFATSSATTFATTTSGSALTLDNSGNMFLTNGAIRQLTRTIPTTLNDAVDIGSFSLTNGGGIFNILITVPSVSFSVAKQYMIAIQYQNAPNNTWALVNPISATGDFTSLRDIALDMNVNNTTASFRIRRSLGTDAVVGTAYITIIQNGVLSDTFTPSTATASVAAPTQVSSSTPLAITGGKLGIGNSAPGATLDVGDAIGSVDSARARIQQNSTSITPALTLSNGATKTDGMGVSLQFIPRAIQDTTTGKIVAYAPNAASSPTTNLGFYVYGSALTEQITLQNDGSVGFGKTSPQWLLNPRSASASQLALDGGASIAQWAFRNAGGNLYVSTTTTVGTATTSISALEISGSGFGTTTVRGLNISGQATSTSNVGINLTNGCYAIGGTCVGGGSGTGSTITAYGTSTPPAGDVTNYKAKTYSVVNGDKIMWWGQCSRSTTDTLTTGYKTSNDGATTTFATLVTGTNTTSGSQGGSIFGYFLATTTYNVTVEFTNSGCDQNQGVGFISQLIH